MYFCFFFNTILWFSFSSQPTYHQFTSIFLYEFCNEFLRLSGPFLSFLSHPVPHLFTSLPICLKLKAVRFVYKIIKEILLLSAYLKSRSERDRGHIDSCLFWIDIAQWPENNFPEHKQIILTTVNLVRLGLFRDILYQSFVLSEI